MGRIRSKVNDNINCGKEKWQPHPQDFIMFNRDGAFAERTMKGGWGLNARDSVGDIVCAAAGSLNACASALQAETEALHQVVLLADQMGIGRLIFATDCMTLKQAMMNGEMDLSLLGIKFRQIKYLLDVNFIETEIIHSLRICNKLAHALASLGTGVVYGHYATWATEVHDFVVQLVSGDLAVL
jgi:hypothetical protein